MADSHPEGVVPDRAGELIPVPAVVGTVVLALAGCAPPAPPVAAPGNPYGVPSEREQWELFGPKRIKSLGSELGNAIKGFRKAVREGDGADAKTLEHEGQEASASPGATRTE